MKHKKPKRQRVNTDGMSGEMKQWILDMSIKASHEQWAERRKQERAELIASLYSEIQKHQLPFQLNFDEIGFGIVPEFRHTDPSYLIYIKVLEKHHYATFKWWYATARRIGCKLILLTENAIEEGKAVDVLKSRLGTLYNDIARNPILSLPADIQLNKKYVIVSNTPVDKDLYNKYADDAIYYQTERTYGRTGNGDSCD